MARATVFDHFVRRQGTVSVTWNRSDWGAPGHRSWTGNESRLLFQRAPLLQRRYHQRAARLAPGPARRCCTPQQLGLGPRRHRRRAQDTTQCGFRWTAGQGRRPSRLVRVPVPAQMSRSLLVFAPMLLPALCRCCDGLCVVQQRRVNASRTGRPMPEVHTCKLDQLLSAGCQRRR